MKIKDIEHLEEDEVTENTRIESVNKRWHGNNCKEKT
jgi:hypothetical protein